MSETKLTPEREAFEKWWAEEVMHFVEVESVPEFMLVATQK